MFVAYQVALELLRTLRPVVAQLRLHDADCAEQITRAGTSVVLNLGEGRKRGGRDRARFYRIAQGSAGEIRAALDVAEAWGWRVEAGPAREVLDRLLGLLWGLCR